MKTITYTISRPCRTSQHYHEPMRITLPASPGVTITSDRSETDPRGRVVRSAEDWVKADRFLGRIAGVRR
jgi:hypothetical protein